MVSDWWGSSDQLHRQNKVKFSLPLQLHCCCSCSTEARITLLCTTALRKNTSECAGVTKMYAEDPKLLTTGKHINTAWVHCHWLTHSLLFRLISTTLGHVLLSKASRTQKFTVFMHSHLLLLRQQHRITTKWSRFGPLRWTTIKSTASALT